MSGTLGVITNNQYGVFQRNVIEGIRQVARQTGYDLAIDSYAEDEAAVRPIALDYQSLDGVCVIANAAPPELLEAICAAGKPLSLVSHHVPQLLLPAVVADNVQGVCSLVQHLGVH